MISKAVNVSPAEIGALMAAEPYVLLAGHACDHVRQQSSICIKTALDVLLLASAQ